MGVTRGVTKKMGVIIARLRKIPSYKIKINKKEVVDVIAVVTVAIVDDVVVSGRRSSCHGSGGGGRSCSCGRSYGCNGGKGSIC